MTAASALAAPGQVDLSFGLNGIGGSELEPHFYATIFSTVSAQADGSLLATRGGWIRRYGPNGSLDPNFASQIAPRLELRAVEADGKTFVTHPYDSTIKRLNADGTLDTSFHGNGESQLPFPVNAIAPLPGDKVLVAGVGRYDVARDFDGKPQVSVARLSSDGSLDPSFGKGGVVNFVTDYGIPNSAGGFEKPLGLIPGEDGGALVIAEGFLADLNATGGLDPSYGSGGVAQLSGSATDFRALPEGKIQLAGMREGTFFVARYGPEGKLDPSYGAGSGVGSVRAGGVAFANVVLWEVDGSVLIGGSASQTEPGCDPGFCNWAPALARFTPGGTPDSTFGAGGALEIGTLNGFTAGGETGVRALASRPGKGVFAAGGGGPAGTVAFIAAVESGGTLDPSFGTEGIMREREPAPSYQEGSALTVAPNGDLLVGGYTNAGPFGSPAIIRYQPNGGIDHSFGNGGYAMLPSGTKSSKKPMIAIATDRDGGSVFMDESLLTRVTPSGEVDTSFGGDGSVKPVFAPILSSVAILPGSKILAAGAVPPDNGAPRMVVVQLLANGSRDPSFGKNGLASLRCGKKTACGARQMAVQPNGRIVLAGFAGKKLAVARLLPDGEPDRSFGHGGLVAARVGARSQATAVATQGNGKILVGGIERVGSKRRSLLLRFTCRGRRDRGFGRAGVSSAYAKASVTPVSILPTGRRIVLVANGPGPAVLAYRIGGSAERDFGRGGGIAPNRSSGPVGALQGGEVVLAWTAKQDAGNTLVELQRLTNR